MEDFQKIIVQILKVQMDHKLKSDKRQQNKRTAGTATKKNKNNKE